ncbi:MAG: hypothetical protein IPO62_11950 [Saprospiraceae bacterium]|nr:hypothetical protein [Saprospiraceae bacterium]MBK9631761.1 hypothetical protein [Saprospiraceae bacterium]
MNNILKSAKRKDPNSLRIYLNQLKSIIVALNHQKKYNTIITLLSKLETQKYIVDYDYWILIEYGLALYEIKSYEKALEISKIFMKIEPQDPYCIFTYALILRSNKLHNKAIVQLNIIFNNLKSENLDKECKSILNDARYLLALSYFETNQLDLFYLYYNEHLLHRKRGIPSIVQKRDVLKEINDIELLLKYRNA